MCTYRDQTSGEVEFGYEGLSVELVMNQDNDVEKFLEEYFTVLWTLG